MAIFYNVFGRFHLQEDNMRLDKDTVCETELPNESSGTFQTFIKIKRFRFNNEL